MRQMSLTSYTIAWRDTHFTNLCLRAVDDQTRTQKP